MTSTSLEQPATALMETIVDPVNLERAWRHVRSNGGAPGPDGITIDDFPDHCRERWPEIERQLLDGRYLPSAARRKSISKPDGGVRHLGIPDLTGRVVAGRLRLPRRVLASHATEYLDSG